MTPTQRKNLLKLARWLEHARLRLGEKLDMSMYRPAYGRPSGATALGCAAHYAAVRGILNLGDSFLKGLRSPARLFGRKAVGHNGPLGANSEAQTFKQVARDVRRYLREQKAREL